MTVPSRPVPPDPPERPSRAPGILYGIGLGGFVDGIVLHQILQWHHMLSSTAGNPVDTVAGLEVNTLADGFFHVFSWLCVVGASIVTLAQWQQGRLAPSWRLHLGGLLIGWGGFNLVEGLVDHQILGIHHVRDDLGGPLAWDLGFLALAVALIAAGWLLQRAGMQALERGPAPAPAGSRGSAEQR
ncbi:DUF2243 domain-containing protein [Nocardioides sp. zg-536]|uniref:DUF2243 domain-containing protein n=1 Tax=Nocardioides faecalis TaxID=2803858 RepID=A0A939BVU1_9ACTN|nr:DUF2243 domain-containing protein [Nocardioides faecalis]MBM9459897.1 DUF2243 domain-containing protein [Nocardioides faecalis]QVI58871.1 DUF2243 domain-containing protein [Nocardioides faecalis]